MKRQLLTFAAAAAVALCTIIACSKKDNANPEKLSLNNGQMSGQDDDPASSISECYRRFTNTIKNKPEDYIPGDAENAFTDCVNGFIDLHNGGGTSLKPPADPVPDGQWDPFFPTPPTRPDPYIDGEQLICSFWGMPYPLPLSATSLTIPQFAQKISEINYFNKVIANAIKNLPFLHTSRDKVNTVINHLANYGGQYLGLNHEKFYNYLINVAYKFNTPLSLRTQFIYKLNMTPGEYNVVFNEVTGMSYE